MIRLRRPQWVVSDEGWEFFSKDRNYMEYKENGISYIVEVERAVGSTVVYLDTLISLNKSIVITEVHKKVIMKRIEIGFITMGTSVEFC